MPLRDYQIECDINICQYFFAGVTKQLCVSPTGTGKATMFANLPSMLERMRAEAQMLEAEIGRVA